MPRGARTSARGRVIGRGSSCRPGSHATPAYRRPPRPRRAPRRLARARRAPRSRRTATRSCAVGRDARRARARAPPRAAGDERERPAELERLAGGEQLDRQDAPTCSRRRAPPCGPRSRPSRRGPPCWRRSGSSRRSPGARAVLFSDARAAAVTCAIMRPDWSPPSRARKAGRPESAGFTSRSMRRSLMAPSSATAIASTSAAMRHRLAVEVAARRAARPSRRTPSGCRWRRSSRPRACAERSARASRDGAVHLRHAAQAVGVLHLAAVAVRLAQRAAREEPRAGCAPTRPGPGAAARRGCAGRRRRRCPGARRGSGRRPRRRLRASRQASASARPPTAVMSCVPLMRARPSFASSTTRREPGGAQRLGRRLAAARRARTRPRRRARAPGGRAAPGRRWRRPSPGAGTTGMHAAVEHRDEPLERLEPHAREALGQHVRAQQHERARLGLAERLADARGVAAHQVQLQLAQLLARDARRPRSCRSRC